MANEELHGTDMVGELHGKRQRRAYQMRNALSQRVVAPFDVIGCARSEGVLKITLCSSPVALP